jgi:transcriptional regulator with XRE-family HTH domain
LDSRGVGVILKSMISEVVKALREARGWSPAELSRRTGLKSGYISQLEAGEKQNPTQKTLEKLARAFEMSLSELMRALGVGGDTPPDAMRDMIIDAEFRELSAIWPRLPAGDRLALIAAAQAMARSRQAGKDAVENNDAPPEYISHAP